MSVQFCLAFPCEAVTVPMMRRVLGDTLRNLGVVEDCVEDILVAVTEACTNVIRHSGTTPRYEVVTSVGANGCVVEVVDHGSGAGARGAGTGATSGRRPARKGEQQWAPPGGVFTRGRAHPAEPARYAQRRQHAVRPARQPASRAGRREDQMIARLAESGRGLQIMRALVDDVTLHSRPGRGTVVLLRKRLVWRQDAPMVDLVGSELRHAG